MEIATIVVLITLQTTYKTIYKTILKSGWKTVKPFVYLACRKAGHCLMDLWERLQPRAFPKSRLPIDGHEEKSWGWAYD